jgi:xanthine dehydrogenase small subunit
MVKFILNNQTIETDLPAGMTVLDFVRYQKNLKGTKIGCREGDCGACTVLVGELSKDSVKYRSMTSCLMPLANAHGKHVVTVEGINKPDGSLTTVQQAMVEENGTQCGFCTVGFVMSLTGFCVDETRKTCEQAISSVDGNICRCTGYKSIERAAEQISQQLAVSREQSEESVDWSKRLNFAIKKEIVPDYFSTIKERLEDVKAGNSKLKTQNSKLFFVGGGTDLYVQRHEEMVYAPAENLFDNSDLRRIEDAGDFIEIGASVTVTDLLISPPMQSIFPNLYKHLKLISSTPIRNMATLAGNFVNASPIGDMTAWFLALDATIVFNNDRELPLRDFYLGYKTLAKAEDEFIKTIRFHKPAGDFRFNFEKVSKRTYLDIASANSAISLQMENNKITEAHVSVGGVAPIPLYLKNTSEFLRGKEISDSLISQANEILQSEISPISDVRGSAEYKRLLLRQLFTAHFVELFGYTL